MGGGGVGRCLFHGMGCGGCVRGGRRCSDGGPKRCDASSVRWVVAAVVVQMGCGGCVRGGRHAVMAVQNAGMPLPHSMGGGGGGGPKGVAQASFDRGLVPFFVLP